MSLFDSIVRPADVAYVLGKEHYLGAGRGAFGWADEFGVLVLATPRSRRMPTDWLELVRWCLNGTPNGGSRQWARVRRYLLDQRPDVSTVISYSDLSVGHTGALYRACNWLWAPTWHRLRPPPTGNGSWTDGRQQDVKDRWVFPLAPDERRTDVLALRDAALRRRMPDAEYREPKIRRGRVVLGTGGGQWRPYEGNPCARRTPNRSVTAPSSLTHHGITAMERDGSASPGAGKHADPWKRVRATRRCPTPP